MPLNVRSNECPQFSSYDIKINSNKNYSDSFQPKGSHLNRSRSKDLIMHSADVGIHVDLLAKRGATKVAFKGPLLLMYNLDVLVERTLEQVLPEL